MNMIAIILGFISLIMLIIGILFFTHMLGEKALKAKIVDNGDCPSGSVYVQVRKPNETEFNGAKFCVSGTGSTGDEVTVIVKKGTADSPTKVEIQKVNWLAIIFTIIGLLGLIGSMIMLLMPHQSTASPTIYVNPQVQSPVSTYNPYYNSPMSPSTNPYY